MEKLPAVSAATEKEDIYIRMNLSTDNSSIHSFGRASDSDLESVDQVYSDVVNIQPLCTES